MALPTPPVYSNPIPNNPFYYPFEWYICGPYNPFIVGSGLFINNDTAYICSLGGGGGVVTGIFAGAGIGVNTNTGNVTVCNTGVLSLTAGSGINLSGSTGAVTINNTKNGTVTAITAGTGLTGGIITASGTIALANTAVTPGLYASATFTVDAQGRITNAVSNTALSSLSVNPPLTSTGGANPTLSINPASTVACGAVQLSNSVTSTSSTTAATSLAAKTIYDIAILAVPKSCYTAPGDILTAVGPSIVYKLPVGSNGQVLTACSTCTGGLYWTAGGGGGGTPQATPTALGTVLACTLVSNTALGCNALVAEPSGTNNTAIGVSSLAAVILGQSNTAVGSFSLFANTNGNQNTAIGFQAGCTVTTGDFNVAVGSSALGCATSSGIISENIAVGSCALCAVTGATRNIALGSRALCSNTSGFANTGIGWCAIASNISGTTNIGLGYRSLAGNLTGNANIGVGSLALFLNATGRENIAIGTCALCSLDAADWNIGIGTRAGANISSGLFNIAIGYEVDVPNPAGDCQLVIGVCSGQNWLTGCSDKAIKPGAGVIDCANTCGTANQVLVSTGANAVQWKSVNSAIGNPNYGSFISTVSQTITTPSTPQPVTFNSTLAATNFSVVAGSRITAAATGLYNLQFSIQLFANPGGGGAVEIWFAKNGVAVPDSNTRFSIKNTNETEFAALNFVDTLTAGQYLELVWSTADIDNYLYATSAPTALGGPAIPSVIVTIVPVGA